MSDGIQGSISDVRITEGKAKYNLPWYRKVMLKLFGRSHFGKKQDFHYHTDENGILVKCYHECKNTLRQASFWIGVSVSWPIEHFLWSHVWPFSILGEFIMGH